MRKMVLLLALLILLKGVSGAVVIDQVLYDPIGTESGGEFVSLYNDGVSVDISGWMLSTSSSATDVVIPEGVTMFPNSYYLIADTNWNTSKDDPSWPEADLESTMTMKNSDSGVALMNNGTIIDAVGWGSPTIPTLYEDTPTLGALSGESLQRVNDTDDNLADFITGIPVFSLAEQGDIVVSVTVLDPVVTITSGLVLEDDDQTEGIQLIPNPGTKRFIPLEVVIESNRNLTVEVSFVTSHITLELESSNERNQTFRGNVALEYYTTPGVYNLTITGDDGSDVAVYKVEVEVLSLVALDVSVEELNFESVLAGDSAQVAGDLDMVTLAPTIENLGNVELDIGYVGTNLYSGIHTINVSALSISLDEEFDTVEPLDTNFQTFSRGLGLRGTTAVGFELSVPEDSVGGIYEGFITLSGVRS